MFRYPYNLKLRYVIVFEQLVFIKITISSKFKINHDHLKNTEIVNVFTQF